MKKNHPLSLYNSDNPPNQPNQESSAQPEQSKSPYLRLIFSGSAKQSSPENYLPETNPDHAAALRYIKESSMLKKQITGK